MYYYIIKPTEENQLKEFTIKSNPTTIIPYPKDSSGVYGRLDYAQHWCDYRNGKITEKQHRDFLGL